MSAKVATTLGNLQLPPEIWAAERTPKYCLLCKTHKPTSAICPCWQLVWFLSLCHISTGRCAFLASRMRLRMVMTWQSCKTDLHSLDKALSAKHSSILGPPTVSPGLQSWAQSAQVWFRGIHVTAVYHVTRLPDSNSRSRKKLLTQLGPEVSDVLFSKGFHFLIGIFLLILLFLLLFLLHCLGHKLREKT